VAPLRLSGDQILAYADLSHDHNPLHVDPGRAAASSFGGIVAHGFLLLGEVLAELDAEAGFPKQLECRFEQPGRLGDVLETVVAEDGGFAVSASGRPLVRGRIGGGDGPRDR
jgi:acyl dehydratase